MGKYRGTINDLGELVELVIKAMFGIVIVYLVAQELIKIIWNEGAARIISIILGLVFLFATVISKRIRKEILDFGKRK